MDTLPICSAKSKQSGARCCNYSVKGKSVCHIHGGKSRGAQTSLGRLAQKKASFKHGHRSKEKLEERKVVRKMIKEHKEFLGGLF